MQENTTQPEKRGPGRPRKEEVAERRRRRSGAYAHGRRLGVDEALLDFREFAYRWINDDARRIQNLTKHDDWQLMHNNGGELKEDATDLGDAVSCIVGKHPDGSPKRAYLARKPKKYYEEDQAAEQAALDEQLAQLRRGNDREGAAQSDYVPHSGINIR